MQQVTSPRLPWWRFLAVATGAAAVTTVALVFVSVQLTPSCHPWCLTGLLYFPISAIGAAIVAVAISAYARRGARGYLLGLLAGAVGYGAAWFYLLEGGGSGFAA